MIPMRFLALFVLILLLLETPHVIAKRKVKRKKKDKDVSAPKYKSPEVEEVKYSSEEEKVREGSGCILLHR